LKKCFENSGSYNYEDLIRYTHDNIEKLRKRFGYSDFKNLFDSQLRKLGNWEQNLRNGQTNKIYNFDDDFFNDWAKVLYCKVQKQPVKFVNPILNKLSNQSFVFFIEVTADLSEVFFKSSTACKSFFT